MTDRRQRNAIVTGAAGGLGRALALRLACEGWRVAVADVDEAGARETVRLVESTGGAAQFERLDVARLEDWQALAKRLARGWRQLDLLVNNAGLGCSGAVGLFPLHEWRTVIDVNLYGAIYGCHTFVELLKRNPSGAHIINVASFAAVAPSPAMAAYNVSKAGVVALSETLYGELRPFGVGVTVVCPMYFRTQILARSRSYDALRDAIQQARTDQSDLTADDVAREALRAMRRNRLYAVPGRQAQWYWWLRRLAPRRFLDGIARDVARWAKEQAAPPLSSPSLPEPAPPQSPGAESATDPANRVH